MLGGKDYASARYIYTNLEDYTRSLFPEADEPLLNYLREEGLSIEPSFYVPILPLVLVNGAEGIGTGWSTQIPQYSPLHIIENLKEKLRTNRPFKRMEPWLRGFKGDMKLNEATLQFVSMGKYTTNFQTNVLEITELPFKKWTRDYKTFLEELIQADEITDIKEHHRDDSVRFEIIVPKLRELAS